MSSNPLIGTWRLVSFVRHDADGQVFEPFGPGRGVAGYIIYAEDGHMMVAMMAADRPKFAAADLRSGSEAEKAEAAHTYVSYSGTYDLYPDRVVHHVELCLFPNWIGTDLVRVYSLDGNRLTLTTPPAPVGSQMLVSKLVWEKVAG